MDGGNFGAPPKPADPSSNVVASCATAASRTSAVSGAGSPRSSRAEMAPTMAVPADSSSGRRCAHASVTAESTCRNAGMPWAGRGGKYVPQ